jgi:outer membrane protein OmpA-like peptidoglycan-associated protein
VALTERFQVPAENLTTQGYGEQYLKVPTQAAEVQNRRVTVRRITPLLTGQEQSTGQAR